jgi:putative ABC transport system permease protein
MSSGRVGATTTIVTHNIQYPRGRRVRNSKTRSNSWQTVGIVGNVRNWFGERPDTPQVYEPYFQNPSPVMTLVVRTSSDPAAFAPTLRRAVWDVDKDQPINEVQTMNQVIADWSATGLLLNSLMGIFGGLGVVLAIVGVFGVMAYTVARRTHEIGIRMALGAQRKDVLRMVTWKGIVLGAFGVGIGLALAAPRLMWLQPVDPVDNARWYSSFNQRLFVFLAAALLIGLTSLLASYIPARRATKVDPMVALRHE